MLMPPGWNKKQKQSLHGLLRLLPAKLIDLAGL
jgi:hypothetical protein